MFPQCCINRRKVSNGQHVVPLIDTNRTPFDLLLSPVKPSAKGSEGPRTSSAIPVLEDSKLKSGPRSAVLQFQAHPNYLSRNMPSHAECSIMAEETLLLTSSSWDKGQKECKVQPHKGIGVERKLSQHWDVLQNWIETCSMTPCPGPDLLVLCRVHIVHQTPLSSQGTWNWNDGVAIRIPTFAKRAGLWDWSQKSSSHNTVASDSAGTLWMHPQQSGSRPRNIEA